MTSEWFSFNSDSRFLYGAQFEKKNHSIRRSLGAAINSVISGILCIVVDLSFVLICVYIIVSCFCLIISIDSYYQIKRPHIKSTGKIYFRFQFRQASPHFVLWVIQRRVISWKIKAWWRDRKYVYCFYYFPMCLDLTLDLKELLFRKGRVIPCMATPWISLPRTVKSGM